MTVDSGYPRNQLRRSVYAPELAWYELKCQSQTAAWTRRVLGWSDAAEVAREIRSEGATVEIYEVG